MNKIKIVTLTSLLVYTASLVAATVFTGAIYLFLAVPLAAFLAAAGVTLFGVAVVYDRTTAKIRSVVAQAADRIFQRVPGPEEAVSA